MAEDSALIEQMKNVSLDGVTDKLTEAQIATVEALQKLQKSRDELESEFNKELNELRAKYDVLYKPLYEKRFKVLTTASGSEYGTPSLPRFWLTAMKNNKVLRNVIEVRDEPILAYLTDVSAEFLEPKKQESFKITMSFDSNPYFTNKTLVKQYNMKSIDGEMESLLQCTEATKIEWLPDMDVTKQKVTKIQRHRRTKETRQKVELEDQPSFFRFFTSQEVPSSETLDRMTEQEIAELEMYVEEDYDIGIIIRDKLIPEAVYWYLGVVDNDDLDDDDVESYEHSDSLTSDSD
ncbi:nucleosome assembly protein, putative [Theileria equi strain WA]|uniref:Nucleosome assembly protein, putative n=1 Tax=Theileria equi strain WA TaxID=1537102 RepID=L1LBR5_THEEQ|nr:nucleosome assembly protein, putative [Theileria equi strain WA]EKX72756.1 nucleosome assembly protein, putative [Theileria equi strain WA]|eukprot:XP_004832208.1 nucleosome assembly protein, putative [Theileria equi strain WA]